MPIIPLPLKQRSAATNGRRRFEDKIDHRSAWVRRWKDLCAAHLSDLGGEGLSETQVSICRRISTIEIELESFEAKMAEGKIIDHDLYGRLCGRLARLVELVGEPEQSDSLGVIMPTRISKCSCRSMRGLLSRSCSP